MPMLLRDSSEVCRIRAEQFYHLATCKPGFTGGGAALLCKNTTRHRGVRWRPRALATPLAPAGQRCQFNHCVAKRIRARRENAREARQRQAIKGAGAASNFIHQHQTVWRGCAKILAVSASSPP